MVAARAKISSLYDGQIAYLLGMSQDWLSHFLTAAEDREKRREFETKFCNFCDWLSAQHLAYGFASFLAVFPETLLEPSLNSPTVGAIVQALGQNRCYDPNQDYDDRLSSKDLFPPSEDDEVLRIYPAEKKESYVELRARRSMPLENLGLERVVMSGIVIADRCK